MSCLKLPIPEIPNIFPISLSLATPRIGLDLDLQLCCKLPSVHLAIPPIAIGLIIDPAIVHTIIAALKGYLDQAEAYLAKLPLHCPLEGDDQTIF